MLESSPALATLTPMFRQYHALKRDHPGAILLFRMGDFYEMFFEDAQEASRLLDLTLTARGKGTDNVAPMCGFPHHQLDAYTAKLVTRGRRVAGSSSSACEGSWVSTCSTCSRALRWVSCA